MNNKQEGKIVRIISNLCTVKVDDKLYDCKPRGKFYIQNKIPLVGDRVIIDTDNNYILDILERKNSLKRPMIANVDVTIIVTSVKEPDLSKTDLLNVEEYKEFEKIYDYYNKIGINAIKNTEVDKLDKLIDGKLVVLTGQSGAGKSTLLNRINPELDLETNEISKALGRGKHTTRHTETFKYKNSYISDTPGFSSLDLTDLTKEDVRNAFIEFGNDCYFSDCNHLKENK